MNNIFTAPKRTYSKEEISKMSLIFDDGDFLLISYSEVVDFSINVYDKLSYGENGFCPVAANGYIKLNINNQSTTEDGSFLYNPSEYAKNRKAYVENRCINESRISSIWLIDENDWHFEIQCKIKATINEELLLLTFCPQPAMGEWSGTEHKIQISNINAKDIATIELEFENCESFYIYQDEIQKIDLDFESELVWDTDELLRKLKDGSLIIKLNSKHKQRISNFFDNRKLKMQELEQYLCGKTGACYHNICRLNITFNHHKDDIFEKESVLIDDIKSEEEIDQLTKTGEETGECTCFFEGGYAKKLNSETIILTFGRNAGRF